MADVPNNGPHIVVTTWSLLSLSGIFMWTRVFAKVTRGSGLWWDDNILIFSWLLLLVEAAVTQSMVNLGFGKHTKDVDPDLWLKIGILTSVASTISVVASTLSKVSFGVTLLRLMKGWMKRVVWFSIATLLLVMLPSAIFTWVRCTPVEKIYNSKIEGTCWDPSVYTGYALFNSAWVAFMDFVLALLPWKLIWGLNMKKTEKVGVGIAMSVGILSGITAIVKGVYLVDLATRDFFFYGRNLVIWAGVETSTAIIAASVPMLRVFINDVKSSKGYHSSKDMPLSRMNPTMRSTAVCTSQARPDKSHAVWVGHSDDDGSDKSILNEGARPSHNGILQTSSVVVEYHERDKSEASSYSTTGPYERATSS